MRAFRASPFVLVSTIVAASCSSEPPPPLRLPARPTASAPAPAPSPAWLPSTSLGELESEAQPVLFARRGDEALVLRVAKGRWSAQRLTNEGALRGAAEDVGPAPAKASSSVVKAVADGYLAAWVEGANVQVLALDAQGKSKGAAVVVGNESEAITWVDVLPNARGALVIWETGAGAGARPNVTASAWIAGKPQPAAPIARSVLGWEALATERGAVLATLEEAPEPPAPAKSKKGKGADAEPKQVVKPSSPNLGRVVAALVDEQGKVGAPTIVSPDATAELDVDLANVGGNVLLTWTDDRGADPAVFAASIDASGKVVAAPRRVTRPSGGQAMLALVAHPYTPDGGPRSKRALLAWEENERVQRDDRLVHLATVGPDGVGSQDEAVVVFHAPGFSGPPDLAPDGDGFAAITLASPRLAPGADVQVDPAAIWPTFVRFGETLDVVASEPLLTDAFPASVPSAVRELSCRGGACTAIANGDASQGPAPLAALSLPIRKGQPWVAPAQRRADVGPPSVGASSVVFDGDHLSKVAAASVEGGTLAAWITYAVEAAPIESAQPAPKPRDEKKDKPQGKGDKKDKKADKVDKADDKPAEPKPKREESAPKLERPLATIGVAPISGTGVVGAVQTLSRKAVSIGGIALAPAPSPAGKKPEVAIAWVARDKDEPHVFVSKLGGDGAKTAQKGVTVISRKKGNVVSSQCSDVAITYTDGAGAKDAKEDGWIVGWVDTRDGNPEVYVAKVDRSLTKKIPDKRITEAVGDASDLQMVVRGNVVFLVWSDARGATEEGHGDIYVARLEASTLKKVGAEQRIFQSRGNSRSPQIAVTDRGVVVAWIEDASPEQPQTSFRVVELDENGNALHTPKLVAASGGSDATIALACAGKTCRSAITLADGSLGAFAFASGGGPGDVKSLLSLGDVPLSMAMPVGASGAGSQIFLAADGSSGTSRVRRFDLVW